MIDDQFEPPSRLIVAPPSLPLIMRREFAGSIHSACVSPCGRRSRVNVCPPSADFQVDRFIAYTVFVSAGSAVVSPQYHGRTIHFWSPFVRCHVAPPSSERKMPPVESSGGHSIVAYTRCGLARDTDMPMRPSGFLGSPGAPLMSRHVSPPSVVFKRLPLPAVKPHGVRCMCQSEANRIRGFDGSMSISTAPVESLAKSTRCHDLPPSVERYTPRVAFLPLACPSAATNTRSGA